MVLVVQKLCKVILLVTAFGGSQRPFLVVACAIWPENFGKVVGTYK